MYYIVELLVAIEIIVVKLYPYVFSWIASRDLLAIQGSVTTRMYSLAKVNANHL